MKKFILILIACLSISCNSYAKYNINSEDFILFLLKNDKVLNKAEIDYLINSYYLDKKEGSKRLKQLKDYAQKENKNALYILAKMYEKGSVYSKNQKKANDYYLKAAELGNCLAMNNLGYKYLNGEIKKEFPKKEAMRMFFYSAKHGNEDSQYQLAKLWLQEKVEKASGLPEKINELEVVYHWAKLSAIHGDPKAADLLLKISEQLDSENIKYIEDSFLSFVEKTEDVIGKYYLRAIYSGDVQSMFVLATIFQDGIVCPYNEKLEVYWLKKSAKAGVLAAMNMLAEKYLKGQGVPQNAKKALKWYKKSVEEGSDDGLLALAKLHFEGEFLVKDEKIYKKTVIQLAEDGFYPAIKELISYYKLKNKTELLKKWEEKIKQGDYNKQTNPEIRAAQYQNLLKESILENK